MPGGFENSAMKSSFSLSSLQPSSASLETPEHARPERPYNSLRKSCRKDPEQESWRRSWDRREYTKDEFWNALKPNYLYLMDSNLIDSCKEAGRDLHYVTSPSHDWSFEQFCTQFKELDLWLTSIQETIYSKEENVTDRNLRLSHVEEMHRKTYKRKVFNNQGGRLAARFPERKEDVRWQMSHLNRKWETLEQTVTPRKHSHPDRLTHAIDVEHELNCLRKWLRITERRLLPINLHAAWTLTDLEVKAKEHQVIQREVELHGKIVCSVLKRCDRLVHVEVEAGVGSPVNLPTRSRRFDSNQAIRSARDLERRWQHLYIRSLEWLCHIENETKRAKNKSPVSLSPVDSDEGEPVHKHPRLSCSPWSDHHHTTTAAQAQDVDGDYLMDVSTSSTTDMVGPQSELNIPRTASFTPSACKSPPSTINRSGSMQLSSQEDVLNENYAFHSRRQSMPLDAARRLFPNETSMFTSSDRPAQNCGTFYYKHCDTESEQDDGLMDTDSKNLEESSEEEEWTYKEGLDSPEKEDCPSHNDDGGLSHSTETLSPGPRPAKQETLPKHKLQKLIEGAVESVHPSSPIRKPRIFQPLIFDTARSKSKVNDWMMRRDWNREDSKTQGESCDASGEYTTEEEERHSSGDFNTSIIHCQQSAEVLPALDSLVLDKPSPTTTVPNTPDHLKISSVVMRTKRKEGTPKRPLSESGLPQSGTTPGDDKLLQSRSESALHQLDHTPTPSVKMDTSVHGTLSSSTTVEEMPSQTQEGSGGGYSTNSLRRRKIKLRKRNLGRKSDSGSDGHEPVSPLKTGRRVMTSGTETEEEDSQVRAVSQRRPPTQPMFRLGPDAGIVTVFHVGAGDKVLSADSSYSEQACWDNYQEKYMSEAYSEEIPDHETTRRLLEFGDDYRNFIDSQSDGASSLGISRPPGHNHKRRQLGHERKIPALDSDSEGQDVCCNLITKSLSLFTFSEQAWTRLSIANPHLVMAKDFAEIISTCKDNKNILKIFLDNVVNENDLVDECRKIKGLMEKWDALETKSEDLQKVRSLQREMAALREELLDLNNKISTIEHDNLHDREQLEMKILQIKGEHGNLRERKSQLIEINTAVHKFFTDSGQKDCGIEAAARLKEDVQELYFVWEETNKRVSQQLERLSQLSAAWQAFENHLAELQVALRGDHNTLRMLDSALQQGPVSKDVASSVIDVAKVLSEKQDLSFQSVCALNNTTPVILSLPGSSEGSLSDSGISDSGSEQESERERRLSALRRLARQLEAVLSPNSQAILNMARRIEQTENELRGLQKTCRELIVRTAVCAEASPDSPAPLTHSPATPTPSVINRSQRSSGIGPLSFLDQDPDDPDPDKSSASWLWRVLRAALPFQMAILAIFCMACLLEPHCCDSMNNLNFSLTPQLRYVRGPPPV